MPGFLGLQKFFGNTVSGAAGYAAGGAVARTLHPELQSVANAGWQLHPDLPIDAHVLAAGVAQGQVPYDYAVDEATRTGIDKTRFDHLVDIANVGPPLGYAYQAWRRGELTDAEFVVALRRTGLEVQWDKAMRALKSDRLDLGAIATAIHRGIMRGVGLIIREPPTEPGAVPFVAQSELDPVAEAEAHGIDAERLRILVGNTGLPPGLIEMLHLLNMGKVEIADVQRAVAESNLRNEYMDVVLNLRRRLLTPHEYEEAALRGVISNTQADDGAALSGMEKADAQLLFQILGRPLTVHQILTGLARGGTYGGTYDDVPEPYRDAIRRSNIRPEYARLAYAARYTYPGAFVLRALTQGGDISQAESEQILLYEGWEPALAAKVAAKWATTKATTGTTLSGKAKTSALTALHKSYVDDRTDSTAAHAMMTALGEPAAEQTATIAIWDRERALVRSSLTATQIKKAIGQPGRDKAWALARLADLGYSPADAETFLAE